MACDRHNFLSFWAILPYYWPHKLNLEKILKMLEDILLHMWTYHKWRSYDVWFLRHKAQPTVFVILDFFCPLTLLTTWKIKILKKWRKHQDISSFYNCVPLLRIIWCLVPEIWSTTDNFLSFFKLGFTPWCKAEQQGKKLAVQGKKLLT